MKITEKMQLVKEIALKLHNSYKNIKDIDTYLSHFAVAWQFPNPNKYTGYSYAKACVERAAESEVLKIANDLDIPITAWVTPISENVPPYNWKNTEQARAFISHSTHDKDLASRLKDTLRSFNINAFVAHADIQPSKEWQMEIRKALDTMDFFVAIMTNNFDASPWCQQEVGYALARRTFIISIRFNFENPPGFLANFQAITRGKKTADQISREIIELLKIENTTDVYNKKIKPYYETAPTDLDEDIPF